MKLSGNQDCPKGIDTAPGSINCRNCQHYESSELVTEGPMSGVVTECKYDSIVNKAVELLSSKVTEETEKREKELVKYIQDTQGLDLCQIITLAYKIIKENKK